MGSIIGEIDDLYTGIAKTPTAFTRAILHCDGHVVTIVLIILEHCAMVALLLFDLRQTLDPILLTANDHLSFLARESSEIALLEWHRRRAARNEAFNLQIPYGQSASGDLADKRIHLL